MAFSKFTYIALLALASVVVPQIDPSSVDIKTRSEIPCTSDPRASAPS